jgi:hypothetical protein
MPTPRKRPSRKRPDSKRSQGIDRHTRPRVAFHMPADLAAALRTLAGRTKRTLTAEILVALEEHLAKNGVWPPAAGEE